VTNIKKKYLQIVNNKSDKISNQSIKSSIVTYTQKTNTLCCLTKEP